MERRPQGNEGRETGNTHTHTQTRLVVSKPGYERSFFQFQPSINAPNSAAALVCVCVWNQPVVYHLECSIWHTNIPVMYSMSPVCY